MYPVNICQFPNLDSLYFFLAGDFSRTKVTRGGDFTDENVTAGEFSMCKSFWPEEQEFATVEIFSPDGSKEKRQDTGLQFERICFLSDKPIDRSLLYSL